MRREMTKAKTRAKPPFFRVSKCTVTVLALAALATQTAPSLVPGKAIEDVHQLWLAENTMSMLGMLEALDEADPQWWEPHTPDLAFLKCQLRLWGFPKQTC